MAGVEEKNWRAKSLGSSKMHIKDVKGPEINIPTDLFDVQRQFQ